MEQANNVEQYLIIISRFDHYSEKYYRGQREAFQTIPPTIARDSGFAANEAAIFNEAIQMSSTDFEGLDSPLERLAKMQHYGIPTRLVDVTTDPLIALYFAVEKADDPSPGNVYLYVHDGYPTDSIEVRTLSVLPMLRELSISSIQQAVVEEFDETIPSENVLNLVSNPVIVQCSASLQKSNPRLYNQKGTFLICGNEVEGGIVTNKLLSLDTLSPNTIIRIPYEYKKAIKEELDVKYNISEPQLFPEFPSVASYLREKYKSSSFSPEDKYHIAEVRNSSTGFAKRVSITIVLDKELQIDEIKQVVIDVIEHHKKERDVVWVYVAKTGDDYILHNWIVRGQWINPSLNKRFQPLPLKISEKGYYWEFEKSYSVMADYNEKYVFEEDKALFIYNARIWDEFVVTFHELEAVYRTGDYASFEDMVQEKKKKISDLFSQLQDCGHSRNKEFDVFLDRFSVCVGQADDIHFYTEKVDAKVESIRYCVRKIIEDVGNQIVEINNELGRWKDELGITPDDYITYSSQERKKPKYTFTPTLPISKDALNVTLEVEHTVFPDKTVQISGSTNLFDGAILLLSLSAPGDCSCSCKATVKEGAFCFPKCSAHGKGFISGSFAGRVTLSIPGTQPKEFTNLAGIEYENLTGDFIKRDGTGPSGKMEFSFLLE